MKLTRTFLGWLVALNAAAADPAESGPGQEIAAARQAGLPTAALEAKAREGAAKGVAAERIQAVLASMRAGLERAAAIVAAAGGASAAGAQGRDRAVEAIADALAAGVSEAQAHEVVAESAKGGQSLAVAARAVSALTDFVVDGMPAQAALGLVKVAMASEGGDERFVGLAAAVNAIRRAEGISAEEAIARLVEEMREGRLPYEVTASRGRGAAQREQTPAGSGPGASQGTGPEQREIRSRGKGPK